MTRCRRFAGRATLTVVLVALPAPPEARAENAAVLVELFTSQGCSSCPPADRWLSELGDEGVDGIRVISLAFHVDYWNYIGWTDPFSSPTWSDRQRAYATGLASGRVYTPQLVVGGREELVGSNRASVAEAVARVARVPAEATVSVSSDRDAAGRLVVHGEAALAADAAAGEIFAALVRDGLTTEVTRGENGGHRLRNDSVVDRLVRVGSLEPGTRRPVSLTWQPPADGRASTLRVVVFVQDARTLTVLGAAEAPIPDRAVREGP